MKNTSFLAIAALLFSASVSAQTTDTTKTTTTTGTPVAGAATSAPVVQSTLPEHLKGVTSSTLKPEHYLPVLGSYQSSGSTAQDLTITLDEQNIGIVWIEGLPQGRVKAYLKKSPATYKIPAQKTAEGKSVSEGTLHFDQATKQLSACIGCTYNEANPASVFEGSSTKAKGKGWKYSGTKVEMTPAASVDAATQQ